MYSLKARYTDREEGGKEGIIEGEKNAISN